MTAEALSAKQQQQPTEERTVEERLAEVEEHLVEHDGLICDLMFVLTDGRPSSIARVALRADSSPSVVVTSSRSSRSTWRTTTNTAPSTGSAGPENLQGAA
jgi:hypothetical protein